MKSDDSLMIPMLVQLWDTMIGRSQEYLKLLLNQSLWSQNFARDSSFLPALSDCLTDWLTDAVAFSDRLAAIAVIAYLRDQPFDFVQGW